MKIRFFTLVLVLILPLILYSQGPSITFGGKKKATPIMKSELAAARKLSAFYFYKNNVDSLGLDIKSYTISIIAPGSSAGPEIDSHTDFFPTTVEEQLHAAPVKTRIQFTKIKAAASGTAGTGVRLLPDLTLVVKEE